jgi:hypothetical protein
MAASTRARVCGRTSSGWLSTFETVPTATPARLATSFMPTAIKSSLVKGSRGLLRRVGQSTPGATNQGTGKF